MLISTQGQAGLAEACPICLHEPVNAEDCRPNKAMRTTIKVFLKKKVMERETARKKEALSNMAATPATPATPLPDETSAPQPSQTPVLPASDISSEGGDAKQGFRDSIHTTQAKEEKADEQAVPTEAQKDIPQMSIEVKALAIQPSSGPFADSV